jgi:predicted GNAT family acetyltransferase
MDPSADPNADPNADPAAPDSGDATPVVTDNPAESRYELRVGGELAGIVAYRLRGQAINLIHTEIDPRFQGAGLATRLARFSLDDARKRNLAVLPTCPYIRSWIGRHPEYADLVSTTKDPETS